MIVILLLITLLIYREQIFLSAYILLGIIPSLLLFLEQLNKVKNTTDYSKISTLLKIIMLVGIFSIFMIRV
jgi:4-hydroxybenzoate polyprenyltransferase